MTWKYKFEKHGGYDCMTSAYNIYDDEGELVCKIDTAGYKDVTVNSHSKSKRAEKKAKLIDDSVNKMNAISRTCEENKHED